MLHEADVRPGLTGQRRSACGVPATAGTFSSMLWATAFPQRRTRRKRQPLIQRAEPRIVTLWPPCTELVRLHSIRFDDVSPLPVAMR